MDEPETTITNEAGEEEITDLELVTKALTTGEITLEVDPDVMSREIVKRILHKLTFDEALTPDDIRHGKEFLNTPFRARSVRWFPSTYEEGPSVYAVVDAVDLTTGEPFLLTIGAANPLAQLVVGVRTGALPADLVIEMATRPTASGFYPLVLRRYEHPKEA